MTVERSAEDNAARVYGARFQIGYGSAYPDLKNKMRAIFEQRIAKLPWVPAEWLNGILTLQATYPDDLVLTSPGLNNNGTASAINPLFLDTPEKLKAWRAIFEAELKAIQAYGRQQAEEGAKELNAFYADAAFWGAAQDIALYATAIPGKIVGAVTNGFGSVFSSVAKSIPWWIWGGLVVGGFLLYKYRNTASVQTVLRSIKP